MNKQEWYSQYRIYRAAISSIDRTKVKQGLSEKEKQDVWTLFWRGLYATMPDEIRDSILGRHKYTEAFDLTSKSALICNVQDMPNSYPRTDVRNTGRNNKPRRIKAYKSV